MKIVFFGTPEYVLPILTLVHKKFVTGPGKSPIVAVVTASPKPFGRKQFLKYTAVDKWAHDHKIETHYQSRELSIDKVEADFGILASYGEIIPKEVIKLFPLGILVIHPSLLPKYRGAAPVPETIKNGETITGGTIFRMDEKVDHGPIITQFKEEIRSDDTADTLRDRIFLKSAQVMVETIPAYTQGKIKAKVQDESEATYTKMVTREDGFINLDEKTPEEAERFIRAMQTWPGAWTHLSNEKRLKLLKAHLEEGKLILDEVQLEGKLPVSYKQFKEAYPDLLV